VVLGLAVDEGFSFKVRVKDRSLVGSWLLASVRPGEAEVGSAPPLV